MGGSGHNMVLGRLIHSQHGGQMRWVVRQHHTTATCARRPHHKLVQLRLLVARRRVQSLARASLRQQQPGPSQPS